jgi:hypothetical protein
MRTARPRSCALERPSSRAARARLRSRARSWTRPTLSSRARRTAPFSLSSRCHRRSFGCGAERVSGSRKSEAEHGAGKAEPPVKTYVVRREDLSWGLTCPARVGPWLHVHATRGPHAALIQDWVCCAQFGRHRLEARSNRHEAWRALTQARRRTLHVLVPLSDMASGSGTRLVVIEGGWPAHVVIGDENSPWHAHAGWTL